MKILLFTASLLIALLSSAQTYTIPIVWQGDSLGASWNPHAALLVPVKLDHSSHIYYMQFDLGSPYSLFYKEELDQLKRPLPTSDTIPVISIRIGNMDKKMTSVPIRSFPQTPAKPSPGTFGKQRRLPIIGTIGADILAQQIIVFDYPHNQLILSSTLPANLPPPASPFYFAGGRIFLPAILGQQQTLLFFDTGSSSFQLLIDSARWSQMADPAAQPISYPVNSWGRALTAHTISTRDSIGLSSLRIPIHRVTYMEGADSSQISSMKKMGIGAVTGNVLFLDYRLILDMQKKLFSLANPQ